MNTRTDPQRPACFDLSAYGIDGPFVQRNLSPAALYEEALMHGDGARIADSGALIAYSGDKTGRSPKDKRLVRKGWSEGEPEPAARADDLWWGPVNIAISQRTFDINRSRAVDYLNTRKRMYVVDAFAGWDPNHRLKVRVVCERPYHALFMWTMLIRPTPAEAASFGEPDWVIFNAGRFPANPLTAGMTSTTSVDLDFHGDRGVPTGGGEVVILGTEYAGEMKKGIFTVMNKLMPERGHLSMHCSATADPRTGTSSLLFGLSGTGKTTLSADPERRLVGDDEHVWTRDGIFNIEGGCYAKAIHLSKENEPQIFEALKFGAVLENVRLDEADHHVDFDDTSITQNTRGAYPLEHVPNAELPAVAGHPTDVIFLTADAFGVLPPVSRLTPEQAMVHFISGYTAKVAGTEQGVDKPEATFSPCFGGPFLVWHPARYAELLAEKIREHDAKVWLVNTGWTGGAYGEGQRISLKHTRAIIDAIHRGLLAEAATDTDPTFGLHVVKEVPGVPGEVLSPRSTWADGAAYDAAASELAGLFRENFKKYEDGVSDAVKAAVPGG